MSPEDTTKQSCFSHYVQKKFSNKYYSISSSLLDMYSKYPFFISTCVLHKVYPLWCKLNSDSSARLLHPEHSRSICWLVWAIYCIYLQSVWLLLDSLSTCTIVHRWFRVIIIFLSISPYKRRTMRFIFLVERDYAKQKWNFLIKKAAAQLYYTKESLNVTMQNISCTHMYRMSRHVWYRNVMRSVLKWYME